MTNKTCLITGVGPGTGAALVRRFAKDYHVIMVARDEQRLVQLSEEIPNTSFYVCDVSDRNTLAETLQLIQSQRGSPTIVIHNAVGGSFGDVLSINPDDLQRNFSTNTMALLQLIQCLGPAMVSASEGAIVATGNTSAYRGVSNFAGFAPSKAAQRILLESAARSLGPKGVHVAYLAIDAVIDVPWARQQFHDKPDDFFCKPSEIADECFHLCHQAKSVWTFDALIRPYAENW